MVDRAFTIINEMIRQYKVPQAGHSVRRVKYNDLREADARRMMAKDFEKQGLKWE